MEDAGKLATALRWVDGVDPGAGKTVGSGTGRRGGRAASDAVSVLGVELCPPKMLSTNPRTYEWTLFGGGSLWVIQLR